MDTTSESTFNVHINDHTVIKKLKYGPGMYYFDTDNSNKCPVNAYWFISTIIYNKSCFSRQEIEGVDRAHDLQVKIGWPPVQDYQNILSKNQNFTTRFTANAINRTEAFYVPRFETLKGKIYLKRPQYVQSVPRIPLPSLLLDHHKNEQIGLYFMFVNV